jgi:hypothetical protein
MNLADAGMAKTKLAPNDPAKTVFIRTVPLPFEGAVPRIGDRADDFHAMRGSPYANIAYNDAATVRLLDDEFHC